MSMLNDEQLSAPMERRAFLRRLFTAGGALSLTAIAAACGSSKAASTTTAAAPATTVAGSGTASTAGTAKAASTAGATTAPPASTAKAATPTTAATETPAAPAAGGFDPTKEVLISYSYVVDAGAAAGGPPPPPGGGAGKGGGRVHNPYIAVWIEAADGSIVRNVSLNYQVGRGDRWLNELRRWFTAEQARIAKGAKSSIDTISSATRVPGTFQVLWDGMDETKQPVALGDYFVCIEASRERGPYEIVRESVSLGKTPAVKALADQGELQKVSVELRARG
jgi:hypothetical protein